MYNIYKLFDSSKEINFVQKEISAILNEDNLNINILFYSNSKKESYIYESSLGNLRVTQQWAVSENEKLAVRFVNGFLELGVKQNDS